MQYGLPYINPWAISALDDQQRKAPTMSSKDTLLDFTVHYLVERPPDIVDFAVDYFSGLQTKRNIADVHNSEDEDMESDEDMFGESKHKKPEQET